MPDLSKPTVALTFAALALALVTSLGSVYLSAGMKLAACPLCYYQRAFAFATLGVLLVGVVYRVHDHVCLPALALPLALTGLGIAAFHVSLELRGKMECPTGATAVLSAPKESLLVLALLALALLGGALTSDRPAAGLASVGAALALAAMFTAASLWTVAMPPPPPPEAYEKPLVTCRPLPRPG